MAAFKGRLRLLDVPRLEGQAVTEQFDFEENEDIVDVIWFAESVAITFSDIEWVNDGL